MANTQTKNHVFGIIGLIGLFLVGGMMGYTLNGSGHLKTATMSKGQCNEIANKIINATGGGPFDKAAQPDLIAQLNKVYSENCVDRIFEQPKPQPKVEEKKLPESNCAAIEELLKEQLVDENSLNPSDHLRNSEIYDKMHKQGCPRNQEKWLKLSEREANIAAAIDLYGDIEIVNNEELEKENSTCAKIEKTLRRQLECIGDNDYCKEQVHIHDAKIYANLSERGCPENSARYKERAKQELEIARALTDDNIEHNPEESVEIVETYKRLQMQAEAERMIEKAKKIANPAIDFIIQLEKIIEE